MNDSETGTEAEPRYPAPEAMAGVARAVEAVFEEMEDLQRRRLLQYARRLEPRATLDDVLDPHSYPALIRDPAFNYEDGYLAGLMAARISLRSRVMGPLAEGRPPESAPALGEKLPPGVSTPAGPDLNEDRAAEAPAS